jgi:hypothetical protein
VQVGACDLAAHDVEDGAAALGHGGSLLEVATVEADDPR